MAFLPYGRHWIDDDDVAAVVSVLRSNSLTGGELVQEFEFAFAQAVEARYAVACANGTAGLHMAVMAAKIGRNDVVCVPSMTFLATANAVRFVDADVIFSDVDPRAGLMRLTDLEASYSVARNKSLKAVIPVHLNGQCVDIEKIGQFAKARGLSVIEDACHAIGASYQTSSGLRYKVGSCAHSDMTVFSLHPVKTIAMGEGGIVTTNDDKIYRELLLLRNHGMTRTQANFTLLDESHDSNHNINPWYYEMTTLGYNYRASEIHCALGFSQLKKLSKFLSRRKQIADYYDELLLPLDSSLKPAPRVAFCESGWHLYVVHIDFNALNTTRAIFMDYLRKRDIGTQVHYMPVHRQAYYRSLYGDLELPGANAYYSSCLSLPCFPAMTNTDIERVVFEINNAIDFCKASGD